MECVSGGFSEEQFQKACVELQHFGRAGNDWELLMEHEGFNIYRQQDEVAFGPLENPGLLLARVKLPRE